MILVTVTRRELQTRGHATPKICAGVSAIMLVMQHRALEWTQRKHPKPSVIRLRREYDELEVSVIAALMAIAWKNPKQLRVEWR